MDPEEWVLKLKQTESGTKYFRFLCSVLKYQRIRHINDFHNLENRRKNQKSFVRNNLLSIRLSCMMCNLCS